MVTTQPILKLVNIQHCFGEIEALKGVSFDLRQGEIHALVGDHRSGKSTLARILSGDIKKQEGEIFLDGVEINHFNTRSAITNKIGTVYQTVNIIPSMTVFENILYGIDRYTYFSRKKKAKIKEECSEVFVQMGIEVDLNHPAGELEEGYWQFIQLAKTLVHKNRLVILDEISQILNPQELKNIYSVLKTWAGKGTSFIYITSNIHEIFGLADRVTVLREGYRSGTEDINEIDPMRVVDLAYSVADTGTETALLSNYDEIFIRSLPVGMLLFDKDSRIILANTKAKEILNKGSENLKGRSVSDALSEIDNETVSEVLGPIPEGTRIVIPDIRLENGRVIQLTASPLKTTNQIASGTTLFVEDVSVKHETREYLMRAEKFASTAQLAAGVAHEINNPLQSIQSHIEYLILGELNEELTDSVVCVQRELDRIVEIVSSLLSFSRAGNTSTGHIDVNTLLDEVVLLLNHRFKSKSIHVSKKYLESDVFIHGNENQIKQLFVNLIMNSIEAVLDDGKIEICMSVDSGDRFCEIEIQDNGNGIPIDIQSDVFEPFYTTKITKTNTGLGLSICQHIVETHGGVITFTSQPGAGTRFVVRLPM